MAIRSMDVQKTRRKALSIDIIDWVPGVTLDEVNKKITLKAIKYFKGNKSAAALSLGITVQTINNWVNKWEKEDEQYKTIKEEREQIRKKLIEEHRAGKHRQPND